MKPENKLLQYSSLAISFLLLKEANSEAVYTDIDPDTIINTDGEHGYIDMDNDGTYDFRFFKFIGTDVTYWSDYYSYLRYIFAAPENSNNALAAIKSIINPSYGGFTQYFPYALIDGTIVDEELSFQNINFQVLAYNISGPDGGIGGKWYGGLTDHYIGIRFNDVVGCSHYGWIRCDVKSGADTLIIKDYAYETKCNVGIIAGDTVGDTTTVNINENELTGINIYSFNSDVYINLENLTDKHEITISDLNGKIVYKNELNKLKNIIALEFCSTGYYLVNVTSADRIFTKKIFIN